MVHPKIPKEKRDTRLDGLYAHVETEFMRNHEFLSLPVGARFLYLSLWCYALDQRRETISRPTDYYLASMAGLHHHPITSYLDRMHVLGLIILSADRVTIVGLHKKHNRITFKDAPEISQELSRNLENPSFLSSPSLSYPNPPPPTSQGVVDDEKPKAESKPKPEPKERKKSTGPHAEALRHFGESYMSKHGVAYDFSYARDGKLMQDMLTSFGLPILLRIIDLFMADQDSYLEGKPRNIPILKSRSNQYAPQVNSKPKFDFNSYEETPASKAAAAEARALMKGTT